MTVVKWSKIVEDLTKDDRIPYLKGCFGNVDDIIYKKISAYQLDPLRLPYDPVHAEALLYDVGARLDRCVVYRREANELTITGIKAELDYQTYIDLRQIDDDLQKAQLRIAQSQSEERGYRSAAAHFGKVASPFAKLAAGFQDQALAIAESSKSTAYAEQFRSDLIAKRRAQLDGLTDKLYSRLGEPGSAHNYGDRWKRVIRLLEQDIRVAYEKARCAEIGLSTLYGLLNLRPLSSPWKADENAIHENVGFLDEFVLWVRDAIDTLETSRQQELEFELTIPFVGMYPDSRNGKRPPLFNRDEFRRIMTGSKRFVFKLKDGISVSSTGSTPFGFSPLASVSLIHGTRATGMKTTNEVGIFGRCVLSVAVNFNGLLPRRLGFGHQRLSGKVIRFITLPSS